MSSLLLLSAALLAGPAWAEEAVSADGTYAVAVPERWRLRDGLLGPRNDQFSVELMDARQVVPADYKAELAFVVKKTESGGVVASWTGDLTDGRAGACVDTRGAIGFKVKIQTFCLVDLDGQHAALLRMQTRNLVKGGEFSAELHDLLDEVRPTGAAPAGAGQELRPEVAVQAEISQPVPAGGGTSADPQTEGSTAQSSTASTSSTAAPGAEVAEARLLPEGGAPEAGGATPAGPSLKVLGYTCTQGRWNNTATQDDLQVWWKADTRELVVHFTVKDGPDTVAFTLGGTVEVGPPGTQGRAHQELFGHLRLREGPQTSVSGIHRFFQSVDVQGTVDHGEITALRTTQDENFTRLGACGSS